MSTQWQERFPKQYAYMPARFKTFDQWQWYVKFLAGSVIGRENIPDGTPVVFMLTHDSMFDPYMFDLAVLRIEQMVCWIAKAALESAQAWRTEILGTDKEVLKWLLTSKYTAASMERIMAHVLAQYVRDTGSLFAGDAGVLRKAAHLLKNGYSIGIFPEGGRAATLDELNLHVSPFILAKLAGGVPVVPVTISQGGFVLPHTWSFTIHKPIDTQDVNTRDVDSLRDKTAQAWLNMYDSLPLKQKVIRARLPIHADWKKYL